MGMKPRRIEIQIEEVVLNGRGRYDLDEWQGEFTNELRSALEGAQTWTSRSEPISRAHIGPGSGKSISGSEAAIACARSLTK